MANISLLAPLLGPILGAFLIDHVSWHWGFIGIALLAFLSWFGLNSKMPDNPPVAAKMPVKDILGEFKQVYANHRFLGLTLSLPMISLPLMLWIALSPVILIEELGLSSFEYGLAQFPVLGGLILGNILLVRIVDKMALGRSVLLGLPIMLVGTVIILLGTAISSIFVPALILGMSLISFGEGISFSVTYRFALMSSEVGKGTVAASVSMLLTLVFFVVIELVRILYEHLGLWVYSLTCFALIALWFTFPRRLLKAIMQERKIQELF